MAETFLLRMVLTECTRLLPGTGGHVQWPFGSWGRTDRTPVDVEGAVELGDFTTNSRVILLSIIAVGIVVHGAFVALALLRLIGLFTNTIIVRPRYIA